MHAAKMLSASMQESNFLYLNGNKVLQPKVPEIITDFLNEGKENYIELRNNLSQYKDIFQFFSTFIQMYFQKSTVRLNIEVSTLRALST